MSISDLNLTFPEVSILTVLTCAGKSTLAQGVTGEMKIALLKEHMPYLTPYAGAIAEALIYGRPHPGADRFREWHDNLKVNLEKRNNKS